MTYIELRCDLFPATAWVNKDTDSEQYFLDVRVLTSQDEIWVYQAVNGTPQLVYNDRFETLSGRRATGWTASTSTGDSFFFQRSSGCGCGNPLRGWIPPFPTVQGALLQ